MRLSDLIKLLRNATCVEDINNKREEIAELIPQVKTIFDYDQQHYAHQYDVWIHSLHTVMGLRKDIEDDMVYLAALLHDIGKPDCRVSRVNDSYMHYPNHQKRSMEILRDNIIPHLDDIVDILSKEDKNRLIYYVEYHDDPVSLSTTYLKKHLSMGKSIQEFQNLMLLQVADAKAHIMIPMVQKRIEICEQLAGDYAIKLYEKIQNDIID